MHLHKLKIESLPPDMRARIFIVIIILMDSDDEKTHELLGNYVGASEGGINETDVTIAIFSRESREKGIKKYTAYLIKGQDKNGSFQSWRRFSQFSDLRAIMVKAWPGCLIPSLPSKNLLLKNEEEINKKRERYLNDFLKKMAMRSYLYYSDQFQALLRSQQTNLSDTFAKWPTPTPESIIVKYKDTFSVLAGKQITNSTIDEIQQFNKWLENNQKTLIEYRKVAKEMAFVRDRYNKYYTEFFKTANKYQQTILSQYATTSNLIYGNASNQTCAQHELQITKVLDRNPYWMLYDMIKNQERDGRAFIQILNAIDYYGDKAKEVQNKIDSNVKGIGDASSGKTNIKHIGKKGTPEQIKYQLQVENESYMKEKDQIQTLKDIIIALVAFIEIENYKLSKRQFYIYTLKKLAKYDENVCEVALKIWEQLQTSIEELVEKNTTS